MFACIILSLLAQDLLYDRGKTVLIPPNTVQCRFLDRIGPDLFFLWKECNRKLDLYHFFVLGTDEARNTIGTLFLVDLI